MNRKLQDDKIKLCRQLMQEILDLPFVIDEATVPNAGVDAAPEQVIMTFHMSLARRRRIEATLKTL